MEQSDTRWSSSIAFIFAASAAAVGLGNIWRFPYIAGENGGGAFVLLYLLFVIVLGIPLLTAEVAIGRMTRMGPQRALLSLAKQSKRSQWWCLVGVVNILAGFLILSYYTVIAGWVLDYLVRGIGGQLNHLGEQSSVLLFKSMLAHPHQMLLANTLIIGGMMVVGVLGIKNGLERTVMLMFPLLIILLLVLLGVAMHSGQFMHGLHFLFSANFSKINAHSTLLALGQAFFSLNIALGVTLLFGAYLPSKSSVLASVIGITIADTGIALLAGMVIFPIAFAHHLQPNSGPSLIFKTLPIAFNQLPFGQLFAVLFFLMLELAAFTSVIALIEPFTHWVEEGNAWSRTKACVFSGIFCWLLSLASVTSFNLHQHWKLFGMNFYDSIDNLTANILLPLGGLLLALFCGWFIKKELFQQQLNWAPNHPLFILWRLSLRYIAPLAIGFILLDAFNIL